MRFSKQPAASNLALSMSKFHFEETFVVIVAAKLRCERRIATKKRLELK